MPAKTLEIHEGARLDIEAASGWYLDIDPALALSFLTALELAWQRIVETPRQWPTHTQGTRKYFVRNFPYLVIYLELESTIHVLAVAHDSRRPDYWADRL